MFKYQIKQRISKHIYYTSLQFIFSVYRSQIKPNQYIIENKQTSKQKKKSYRKFLFVNKYKENPEKGKQEKKEKIKGRKTNERHR